MSLKRKQPVVGMDERFPTEVSDKVVKQLSVEARAGKALVDSAAGEMGDAADPVHFMTNGRIDHFQLQILVETLEHQIALYKDALVFARKHGVEV